MLIADVHNPNTQQFLADCIVKVFQRRSIRLGYKMRAVDITRLVDKITENSIKLINGDTVEFTYSYDTNVNDIKKVYLIASKKGLTITATDQEQPIHREINPVTLFVNFDNKGLCSFICTNDIKPVIFGQEFIEKYNIVESYLTSLVKNREIQRVVIHKINTKNTKLDKIQNHSITKMKLANPNKVHIFREVYDIYNLDRISNTKGSAIALTLLSIIKAHYPYFRAPRRMKPVLNMIKMYSNGEVREELKKKKLVHPYLTPKSLLVDFDPKTQNYIFIPLNSKRAFVVSCRLRKKQSKSVIRDIMRGYNSENIIFFKRIASRRKKIDILSRAARVPCYFDNSGYVLKPRRKHTLRFLEKYNVKPGKNDFQTVLITYVDKNRLKKDNTKKKDKPKEVTYDTLEKSFSNVKKVYVAVHKKIITFLKNGKKIIFKIKLNPKIAMQLSRKRKQLINNVKRGRISKKMLSKLIDKFLKSVYPEFKKVLAFLKNRNIKVSLIYNRENTFINWFKKKMRNFCINYNYVVCSLENIKNLFKKIRLSEINTLLRPQLILRDKYVLNSL